MSTQHVTNDLHNPIIKEFKKCEVYSFKGSIWGADTADMQLISKYNKGVGFLFCVIDIYGKYAWEVFLKYKKKWCIIPYKPMFMDSNIEIKLTYSERDSVVTERFIRTLRSKIYKCMTSKNVYIMN